MLFHKYQATGNDFIILDARSYSSDWQNLARKICDRHFGIGGDGLVLLTNSDKADIGMRIFNPDGSEAEICVNGIRCLAKFAYENSAVRKDNFTMQTGAGMKKVELKLIDEKVTGARISMGKPNFMVRQTPLEIKEKESDIEIGNTLKNLIINIEESDLRLYFVSMGNPHAVSFISSPVDSYPLDKVGPLVEHHQAFPKRTNFEIANILDRGHIEARVWERGTGETLSCGSGACAIVVSAIMLNMIDSSVDIKFPGGTLSITWDGTNDIYLAGPVDYVFSGELLL